MTFVMNFYKILSLFAIFQLAKSGIVRDVLELQDREWDMVMFETDVPLEFEPKTEEKVVEYPIDELAGTVGDMGNSEDDLRQESEEKEGKLYFLEDIKAKIESFDNCKDDYPNLEIIQETYRWLGAVFKFPIILADGETHTIKIKGKWYHTLRSFFSVYKEQGEEEMEPGKEELLLTMQLLWGPTCAISTGQFQVVYVVSNDGKGDFVDIVWMNVADRKKKAVFVNTLAWYQQGKLGGQINDLIKRYYKQDIYGWILKDKKERLTLKD